MKAHKEQKRKEAEERNSKWAALTYEDQISYLDKTFGLGRGAAKQRIKIAHQIAFRDSKPNKKGKKK